VRIQTQRAAGSCAAFVTRDRTRMCQELAEHPAQASVEPSSVARTERHRAYRVGRADAPHECDAAT
jgi:hypothetical protein